MAPPERAVIADRLAAMHSQALAIARKLAVLDETLETLPDDPQTRDLRQRVARAFAQATSLGSTLQYAERALRQA
jgi:hypothetical protein